MIPTEPKKIRALIRRIQRKFEKDPDHRDGSGSRFLIGPLHLLMGDVDGAMKHYSWFENKFPDSTDEPSDAHCWALTMLRSGRLEDAIFRLRRTYLANPYMIPASLGLPHGQPDVRRSSNWEDEIYVVEGPPEFMNLWQPDEKLWLKSVWESATFKELVQTHIELRRRLNDEEVGPVRSELVDRLMALGEPTPSAPRLKVVPPFGPIK